MKDFRDDIRARAAEQGRNPDDVKTLFLVSPVLGETEAEARDKYKRATTEPFFMEKSLALVSALTDIDFKQFDLDQPLPERLVTNGEQGTLDKFQQWGSGKPLRELVVESSGGIAACIELVGTPDQVADLMGDAMATVGGDGFLITSPGQGVTRRNVIEVTDGLVPALQRRGLVRTRYEHATLRDNLRAF